MKSLPVAQKNALTLYANQLIIQVGWAMESFFDASRLDLGLRYSTLLLSTSVATTSAFSKISKPAAALFAPVVAWNAFAIAWQTTLVKKNPRDKTVEKKITGAIESTSNSAQEDVAMISDAVSSVAANATSAVTSPLGQGQSEVDAALQVVEDANKKAT